MSDILSSLPMYMMIGIVVVIGISQFNRIIGGILGVVFWVTVAIIGTTAYNEGGAIGIPGLRFSREVFYLICALFAAFSGFSAFSGYVKKTRGRNQKVPRRDED